MKTVPAFRSFHILIIGAAGGIGRQCVEVALAQGHHVTAVVRNPSKLAITHDHLKVVKGDINDPGSFAKYLKNIDVAISAIGVSGGLGSDKPTTLYSRGAAHLLQAVEKAQVPRAFFISASALEVSPVIPFFTRLIVKYVIQKLLKHMYADLRVMENVIKMSNVNWTIIRPPQLTDKPLTSKYRIAINTFLKSCLKISRADVAHFMIRHITDEDTYKATVEISY
jgi:putative NADH-flavin reductase